MGELRKILAALAEDGSMLHAVLDKLPVGAYLCDNQGRITYFNPCAAELWGRAPGKGHDASGTGPLGQQHAAALALARGHDLRDMELVLERPDGSARRVLASAFLLDQPRGASGVAGVLGVLTDATGGPGLQDLARLLESIDDHFVCYDRAWRYTYVTEKGAAVLGKTRAQLLGHCIWDLFPDAVGNPYYQAVQRAARSGQVVRLEHYYAPLGRWFDNHIYPSAQGVAVFAADITERKTAELALRHAEQRQGVVLDMVPAGIYWTDAQGGIRGCNRRAIELWGRPPDLGGALRWCGTLRMPGPEGAEISPQSEFFTEALRSGKPVRGREGVIERPDGSHITISLNSDPLFDDAGSIIGTVNVFQDITERWHAAVTGSRLAAIVESSNDAIIGKTLEGVVTSWNAAAERLFGWSATEMLGRTMEATYQQERLGEEARLLALIRAGQRVSGFETVRRRRDGALIDISVTVSPVRDAGGRIIGASSVARDIGPRKASERALQRQMRQQAALYQMIDQVQRAASMEAVYEAGLQAIIGALGCERAAILICDAAQVMRFKAWRGLSAGYRSAVEGHSPWRPEEPDPQPVEIADIATAALDPALAEVVRREGIGGLAFYPLTIGGALIGKFMVYYDAAHGFDTEERGFATTVARQLSLGIERKRAEQALRDAARRKDEFLATLAHELRNPLAPIRNGLAILQHAGDRGVSKSICETMDRQSAQLVRLVDDLMDVSRISRDRLELRREVLDLNKVLEAAVETCQPLLAAANHRLAIALPEQPLLVDGDSVRLTQVFANLLNNAAKYTEPGGRIELRASVQGAWVCVQVCDSGIGIPPEVLPHVFEMFMQADRSLERSRGGLGIGLTLVDRLVALHGGEIEAKSGGPGLGSEFSVRLPLLGAARQPGLAATACVGALPQRRVLVADDNRDAAESLAQLLGLLGQQTRVAYDGQQAIDAALEFLPDVVMLDLGMPQVSGYGAARAIRERLSGRLPLLVALTGWGQEEDRQRTREAGFDKHLVKPVDVHTLVALLESGPAVQAPPAAR